MNLRVDLYGKIISGYPQENFGYFAFNVMGDDTIAGWVGLTPMKDHPHIELLYGVGRKHWGQGYATEAAGTMLRYAFKRMNLPEVVAVVNPANVASRKVVEKLAMTLRGHIEWPKQGVVELFGIDQQGFNALVAGA
jgi:[ribosomal protein S5]-alanine N-acetyltransferase